MIHCNEVTVHDQGPSIFQSVDLHLQRGVSYLVTGQNGSGKTTLLKFLAGKILPRHGTVTYDFIDDQLGWDEKFALRKKYIHFVPTHALHELVTTPQLYYQQRYYTIESTPLPTGRDYLGERLADLGSIQLPDSFQLHHLLELELTRLSNGQVKKLIILKQLLDSIPYVLILDYPFEGLDLQSRMELRDFLDHLVLLHGIQLIIADHEHPQLPKAITKTIDIQDDRIVMAKRAEIPLPTNVIIHATPERKETEPVVEMHEVKIQYGAKVILQHLNWKINRGERWALTGRNGSGKTTLFSLIYADHPMAYSEKVFLFGKRRGTGESIWDIKKRISYLGPEQLHFLDYDTEQLTVHEYLKKVSANIANLTDLINYFDLNPLLSNTLRHLSNGQLQLVLMVALFLSQKELLLLDEPFQFLDPFRKQLVFDYLETHMDESVTLVLITHYESDVDRWTNHRLTL